MAYNEVEAGRAVEVGHLGLVYRLHFRRAVAALVHKQRKFVHIHSVEQIFPQGVVEILAAQVDEFHARILPELGNVFRSGSLILVGVARIVLFELLFEPFVRYGVRPLLAAYFGAAGNV